VSLLSILAFTRVGFLLFWRASKPDDNVHSEAFTQYETLPSRAPLRNDKVIYLLLAGLTAYVVFASPVYNYVYRTAVQIKDNPVYEAALLKRDAEGKVISVQPFDPEYLPETKYGGENPDPNAHLIPYVISPATLEGENISEFKQRQINEQYIEQKNAPSDNQLKPQEGP
ncbi:monovalent cation/H+ antiporter subunit D, partial [Staphylococcus aureus]